MKVLIGLKLTSDDLMRTEVIALKNASPVKKLFVMTDSKYKTEIDGVKYFYINSIISKIPVLRVFFRIPIMLKICIKENIDLLICYHLTSYGFVGFIVSRLLKLPLSIHFLGKDLDVQCQLPLIGNLLLKCAKAIDVLTVQGTRSKKFLEKKSITNVYIIPTACDIEKFIPQKQLKEYNLIFVGRLSKEKRVDRFIEIVNILKEKKFFVKALIVGSGPVKNKILSIIDKYGLKQHIHYVGWKDDVAKYLAQAKVFVLTSDNDQLPSSLLEAMAMGLVPVVSNVGNLSDVVDEKCLVELDYNCKEVFADKILAILTNEALFSQLSKQSINKVKEFSIDANSVRWEYVINRSQRG